MKVCALLLVMGSVSFLTSCGTMDGSPYEAALKREGIAATNQKSTGNEKDNSRETKGDGLTSNRLSELNPSRRPPLDSDEAGLWMVMDNAEKELKSSGRRFRDKALNAYVRGVVCQVAQEYCKDIRVYLMRVPYFNATMAPNGAMEIWTGLLLRARNEAQLASIIGHELGHYMRRHSLQMMRTAIDTAGGLTAFQLALGGVGLGAFGQLATLAALGGLQAYSRDFEREADGYGIVLMSKAGYDPKEAAKVWENLIREKKAEDEDELAFSFLSTHPQSEERLEALKDLGERIGAQWQADKILRERYLAAIAPHRSRFLSDELHLRRFKRTQELLNILIEDDGEQPDLLFFQGELYRLRDDKGDRDRALAAYRRALEIGTSPPELHRSMGLILLKEKQVEAARESFSQYLKEKPDADDARMIRHLMR